MSAISTYLEYIRSKIYAKDVRTAIVNAISQCYDDVNAPALQTEAMQAAVQAKIDAGEMAAYTVADGTFAGSKLENGAVTTAKIADGAVTAGKIANGVVPTVDATLTRAGAAADAGAVGDAIASIEPGLSADAKAALLACFEHVAWTDGHGQDYYDALEDALYPESSLPVVKLFVGKGISGASLVDNAKRILSEPILFDNTKPITVRWQGIDGYRYSIKNMLSAATVDRSGTTLYPAQYDYGLDTDSAGAKYEGWAISDDTQTRGHSLDYAAQTWEPLPYNETSGYLRILIANRDALSYDLPSTMPSGYITVQGTKYKIEVKNKNEFV